MPGFLLEDDAVSARLGEYDSWLEERKKQADEAKKAAQAAVQPAVQAVQTAVQPVQQAAQPLAQPVQDALGAYDNWLQQRTQSLPQPAAQPTPSAQGVVAGQSSAGPPSLPHAEEPATPTDTVAAPDLAGRWKTSFDFGATYTGDYRTGTPHRGVDLVPQQGGVGAEVDAFAPGTVTNISRDSGAGGLMVYVRTTRA
jgi:murein DD-endopeptidase MepM/ murein hydrolase activator NlpD